ncbi:MAG: hypothetical protein GY851_06800 [bacterium]|nr:hypothetical protein [bacterium]
MPNIYRTCEPESSGDSVHVIRAIHALHGDDAWIAGLYSHLKAYLDWWLENRTDERGGLHCHCDWESGQDGSRRFPENEGADADSVRTVDVEAAMAEALGNMAELAEIAGRPEDRPRWEQLAAERVRKTRAMFVDGWFRDFDTRTEQPIILPDYTDIMMLAPLACGVATPEQVEALRLRFQHFRENPRPWLEWPSFFLVYGEAAWTAGLHEQAGEVTADIADRVYRRLDRRDLQFDDPDQPYVGYRVPGVACEYWPIDDDTEPGGEAYGWGATLPLYIIRDIVGFRESNGTDGQEFLLAPALPERLRTPGKSYAVRNLSFHGVGFAVCYEVWDANRLRVILEYESTEPIRITVREGAGRPVASGAERRAQGRGLAPVNEEHRVIIEGRVAEIGTASFATRD